MREVSVGSRQAERGGDGPSAAVWLKRAALAAAILGLSWAGYRMVSRPSVPDEASRRLGERLADKLGRGRPMTTTDVAQGDVRTAGPEELTATDIFRKVAGQVVVVRAKRPDGEAQGSGVVIAPSLVITNKHVVERAYSTTIGHVEREFPVESVRLANEHDLAVLSVPGLAVEPLTMRSSTTLEIGERAFVVGAPRGLELSLAEGLVSGLREYEGGVAIQTSAPVSPGSSGGGLFDGQGNLIGITTFAVSGENLNFALPVEWASELAGLAPPLQGQQLATASDATGLDDVPPPPQVVVGSLSSSRPQTEEEQQRAKAEAIFRPRIEAVAGNVKELRTKTRRYYAACYNRKTVRVTEGDSSTTSVESGGGRYSGSSSTRFFNGDGDYVGRGSGTSSGAFGWRSVQDQSSNWIEVSTLDNSTTTECRLLASDIEALLPPILRAMQEADDEAVKQGVWTWLQRDVPEKLVAELW